MTDGRHAIAYGTGGLDTEGTFPLMPLRLLRRLLVVASLCAATLPWLLPAAVSGAATAPQWGLGVFRGSGRADLVADYEAWLGRPVGYALDFVGQAPVSSTNPWETIDDPSWWCTTWVSRPQQLVLSTAMLPNTRFSLAAGARGDYDVHWRRFASTLVAGGCADTIVRIGWEFNGKFYPWAAGGKEASYAAYWRRIVTAMRGVAGQRFTFDWAPLAGNVNADVEAAYPGNAYVDLIGLDAYDTSTVSAADPAGRWADQLTRPYGLQWQDSFARARGKRMSLPEWGLTAHDSYGLGGGDNPAYLTRMWDWIARHDYLYANYFEVDAIDSDHRLMTSQFPKSAAEYRRLVNGSSPTGVTASPGATSALVTWSPPTLSNGAPPTGYVVTPYRGAVAQTPRTFTDALTAHNVTSLTPGLTYTFTVAATNAIGTGPPSQRTRPVTVGSPSHPTAAASSGFSSAVVSWTVPATNGSAITGYVVTPHIGYLATPSRTFASTSSTQAITGLANGATYRFTVAAINAHGTGASSLPTSAVTVGTPSSPTAPTARSGSARATVSWTAPTQNGGSPITGYEVTPYVGYFALPTRTFSSTATTQVVTGLTSGTTYRFTVTAINARGDGPASVATNPVTPT